MPDAIQPHRTRVRLFRTSWLEVTTLTPFPLFAGAWAVILFCLSAVAVSNVRVGVLLTFLLVGGVVWSLFEYCMHRFVMHLDARSPWLRRLIHLLHENHHQDPSDPLRGLMPLSVTVPVAAVLWVLAHWLGHAAEAGVLGFLAGYVAYDATHWACHQRPMRGRLGAALKLHHLRHHHAAAHRNFAITAIFLDSWFGTKIRRR